MFSSVIRVCLVIGCFNFLLMGVGMIDSAVAQQGMVTAKIDYASMLIQILEKRGYSPWGIGPPGENKSSSYYWGATVWTDPSTIFERPKDGWRHLSDVPKRIAIIIEVPRQIYSRLGSLFHKGLIPSCKETDKTLVVALEAVTVDQRERLMDALKEWSQKSGFNVEVLENSQWLKKAPSE
jgi:hypothetical protein